LIGANGAAAKAASPGDLASEVGALVAFSRGLGARGLWLGLGLTVSAAVFTWRFHRLSRQRLAAVPA
jgi:hypothetical protein